MKLVWIFSLSVIFLGCTKKGPTDDSQAGSKFRLPHKVTYYEADAGSLTEALVFNYDSLPNTISVSREADRMLRPDAQYTYNSDGFLTGYENYDGLFHSYMARRIVIKRDPSNRVLSMITKANGPSYQSDTADFTYAYSGSYLLLTVLTHGFLNNFQATDVYRVDTSVYHYVDSNHQLLSIHKGQEDNYLGYTSTNTNFVYQADGRIDSIVTSIHYYLDYGTSYHGTKTTSWVRKYTYQPGPSLAGTRDYFKETLLGKDYYLAPFADLFYYNEWYRQPYQFNDISLRRTPEPYISRTGPFRVNSIVITRTSDIVNFYDMPSKEILNYSYSTGFLGRMEGYKCNFVIDGNTIPEEKIVFEY